MKKLFIAVVLFISLMTLTAMAQSSEEYELLCGLGAMPDSITEDELEMPAEKQELAYIVAKLLDGCDREAVNTGFMDVTGENSNSGYIAYLRDRGIITGIDEKTFNPEGEITPEIASIVFIKAIGANKIAEQNGYVITATQLGMFRGVKIDEPMNKGQLVQMCRVLLDINIPQLSTTNGALSYSFDTEETFLGKIMKMSVYEGVVEDVNDKIYSAQIKITSNKNKGNYKLLNEGTKDIFESKTNIDINHYKNAPCQIWINEDNVIVYIKEAKNSEIRYTTVYSVNGDEEEGSKYSIKYIDRMTFYDDKKVYKTSDDVELTYNNKKSEDAVWLVGNFVKVVLVDGKIYHVEAWELKSGGLITSISNKQIDYISGEKTKSQLSELDDYDMKLLFVDGESRDISTLNTRCYFDYYIDDSRMVLVASEKLIYGLLKSYSAEHVSIGNVNYDYNLVYTSLNSANYVSGQLDKISGKNVEAYFNYCGKCTYICVADGGGDLREYFIAILDGYYYKEDDSQRNHDPENIVIKIFSLENQIIKQELPLKKNVTLLDGVTIKELLSTSKSMNDEAIYEFRLNGNGEVSSIGKPKAFYGYDEATLTIGKFPNDMACVTVGVNNLYFQNAPIVAIYEDGGHMTVESVVWGDLKNKNAGNLKMKFYGDEKMNDVRLAVLYDIQNGLYSTENTSGVVTKKEVCIDDDDNVYYKITVLSKGGVKEYTLNEDAAAQIPENSFIVYYDDVKFMDNSIKVEKCLPLNQPEMADGNKFRYGIVGEVNDKRIFFDDGSAYFLNPTTGFVIDATNIDSPELSSLSKINSGDTILYYYEYDVKGIVILED